MTASSDASVQDAGNDARPFGPDYQLVIEGPPILAVLGRETSAPAPVTMESLPNRPVARRSRGARPDTTLRDRGGPRNRRTQGGAGRHRRHPARSRGGTGRPPDPSGRRGRAGPGRL